eukprot:COSAG02_NODE_2197_length_9546_cov_12.648354_4_plen_255_part_00
MIITNPCYMLPVCSTAHFAASLEIHDGDIESMRNADARKEEIQTLIARSDLTAMTMKELREHAASCGISADAIEAARDGENPKMELTQLIEAAAVEAAEKLKAEQEAAAKAAEEAAAKLKAEEEAAARKLKAEQAHATTTQLIEAHQPPSGPDLTAMTMKELREHAASCGISADAIEAARDGENPKMELTQLIEAYRMPPSGPDLTAMTMKELREHAASCGISADAIEAARDGENPKMELTQLIEAHQQSTTKQ